MKNLKILQGFEKFVMHIDILQIAELYNLHNKLPFFKKRGNMKLKGSGGQKLPQKRQFWSKFGRAFGFF